MTIAIRELVANAFDGLESRIAIVAQDGAIVAVNAAWREVARCAATRIEACGPGANYLDACDRAAGPNADGDADINSDARYVADGLRAVLAGGQPVFELVYPCPTPQAPAWFRVRITPLAVGTEPYALVVHDDVTRLQLAERARDESFARYSGLAETSPDAIFINRDDRIVFTNHAMLRLLGTSDPQQVLGRPVFDFFHPEDHDLMRRRIARMRDWQMPVPAVEERLRRLDGTSLPVEVVAAPFKDHGETAIHVVLRDISSRKNARDTVAFERQRLSALLNALPDFVWMKDVAGHFVSGNAAFSTLLGVPSSQYLGRTDADFFPPAVVQEFRRADEAAIARGPMTYEEWVTYPRTGWRLRLETTKVPVRDERGALLGVLGIARDVTEIRSTADALRESEHHMRLALEAAQLGTWKHVIIADELYHDERATQHMDLPAGPIPFSMMLERIHPDDRADLERRVQAIMQEGGESLIIQEMRVRHTDGSEHWLSVHARFVFDGTGRDRHPVLGFGTTQDITERKRTEQTVARFMAASPALLYALEATGHGFDYKWSSGNAEAFTGWGASDVTQPGWWEENLHPDDRERVIAAQQVTPLPPHIVVEFRFRRKDGSYIWVRDEKRTITRATGVTEMVGSWTDVTARVQLEEQLRQAQKLEAVGQLAGGIAHDFNNLLTVIAGNSELLAQQLTAGSVARQRLDEINDAGRRAAALTRQLLAFSRSQLLAPRVVELNSVVQRVQTMLQRLIGEDITLTCDLSPEAGQVKVDPGQLEQVIVNLAVNARDAMPDGGRLTLETRRVTLGEDYCVRHADVAPGVYARLQFTDTGLGMSSEVKARIFEPFFTTKPVGKGTGLGLSTVFGIVKQSGGHLDVESAIGTGSSFQVLLPSVVTVAATFPADAHVARPAANGHETVLLVEDEDSVRRLARMALERHGYQVVTAENGRAALAIAEDLTAAPIDLVITDVVMPEMSGRQLVDILRTRRPGLKVLFMSGYIQDSLERHDVVREPFLHKPFTLSDFASAVRRVLDGLPPPGEPPAGPGPRARGESRQTRPDRQAR